MDDIQECQGITALQLGENQNLTRTNVDMCAGEERDVRLLIENIIKGLSYLTERAEYLVVNEYWEEEMMLILNLAEELDNKLATTAEKMESLQNGECLTE